MFFPIPGKAGRKTGAFQDAGVHFPHPDGVFLIGLAAIFLLLCIIQSPAPEDLGDHVGTRRTGYQPCMLGILHGCSVWSGPQQSQTWNHDHLACETVAGDGTRLQLVLYPRTEASSPVFPLDSQQRS